MTVWNAVSADVLAAAAVVLPSLTCDAVAACSVVEPGHGYAVELVPVAE